MSNPCVTLKVNPTSQAYLYMSPCPMTEEPARKASTAKDRTVWMSVGENNGLV